MQSTPFKAIVKVKRKREKTKGRRSQGVKLVAQTHSTKCSSENTGELGVKLKIEFERGSNGEKEQVIAVEV